MNLQEKYDELNDIVDSLDCLIGRITDKDYIDGLEIIKFDAQREIEEIEPQLIKERDKEEAEMELAYERMVV
jgi:hypothetical protein